MRIHQPIPETPGRVATPDGTVQVMPYQIVVMVSIAANRVIELPSDAPRFPAVLDTGNNHNFAIRQEQFARWTGLRLPKRGLVNVGDTTIPLHAANVWIHPDSGDPFRLRIGRRHRGLSSRPGEPGQAPDSRPQGARQERPDDRDRREEKGSHDQHLMTSLGDKLTFHAPPRIL